MEDREIMECSIMDEVREMRRKISGNLDMTLTNWLHITKD